ncbi:heme A synthase [Reinekea sp. G2M2-21]|uniref:COX15/CtaA family protein n=1 Tax=Reinekea sp. G2M2-21 TaxID=2788942 RepID=UPI0018AB6494|nr:COX15/CtaA family protein [Reinekea sp. G2M2-21]
MNKTQRKPGFYLAIIATLMAAIVVVLGAFTRLVDAGLGCPDWPTCYGHFWAPQSAIEIAVANETFPEIPVDLDKTWPEMVHRYLASSLGLLIIGLVVVAVRQRKNAGQPFKLPLFLLAFVILQGAFGAWTVTLKLWPQVVTAHLLGGFTTFTLLAILSLRLSGLKFPRFSSLPLLNKPTKLAGLTLAVVILQVFLGGWTTSNYAALACPDFPTCQAQWWPETDFIKAFDFAHPVGPNYQGGHLELPARTAIHMMHRVGAIVVTLFTTVLAVSLFSIGLRRWSLLLIVLLTAQVSLGISNIVFGLPLAVAVLHNLGGALLLISTAIINVLLHRKELAYV